MMFMLAHSCQSRNSKNKNEKCKNIEKIKKKLFGKNSIKLSWPMSAKSDKIFFCSQTKKNTKLP